MGNEVKRTPGNVKEAPKKIGKEAERVIRDERERRDEEPKKGPVMFIVESSEFEAVKKSESGGDIYRAKQNVIIKYRCPRSDYDMTMTRKKGELFEIGLTCRLISVERNW